MIWMIRQVELVFQSTPPRGGRRPWTGRCCQPGGYFNPRPPRGGRRRICSNHGQTQHFNPRPPRGGRRGGGYARWWGRRYFNPRPPRGGRQPRLNHLVNVSLFQSTPPARGATLMLVRSLVCGLISIHAPREGGDFMVVRVVPRISFISIHAPREGGDHRKDENGLYVIISIHAPREGGDHTKRLMICARSRFQSTPPARGATSIFCTKGWPKNISIHAPREGGDGQTAGRKGFPVISIHAPREGGDPTCLYSVGDSV